VSRHLGPSLVALVALVVSLVCLGSGGVSASAAPGPPEAPEWWFDSWDLSSLWASGADGRGVTVAVIDTGVQADLPELTDRVLPGADFIGNGTDGRIDFDGSDFSHGTAMASIIVARRGYASIEGVAPAARILPIAVPLRGVVSRGVPSPDTTSVATAAAIRYAADHDAKIISMSLGSPRYPNEDELPCPPTLQDAIVYAIGKGSLVIAAAGNGGADRSPVEEPSVCLGTISVGSVNAQLTASAFSSRHPYLTLSAPGEQIPTLTRVANRAFVGGGTSQATALASAAVALVWSRFPSESGRQILSRVLASVTDEGPKGRDPLYGAGVINPKAAIAITTPAVAANPVFQGVQPLLAMAAATPVRLPARRTAGDPTLPLGQLRVGKPAALLGVSFFVMLALTMAFGLLSLGLIIAGVRRQAQPMIALRT